MDLPWRVAYTKREDNIKISTIEVICLDWWGKYETALSIDGKPWRVYKGYNDKESALKGHNEFINMTKDEILNMSSLD